MNKEILCSIKDTLSWVYIVKVQFLKDFPNFNPKKDVFQIFSGSSYEKYLHNLDGPAVIPPHFPAYYYVDGINYISLEDYKREIHNKNFNNKFNELINEN